MNVMSRAARTYYRANVHAWQAMRRHYAATLAVAAGVYLAFTLGLGATGHTEAAWIAAVAIGVPLLVAGWMT